MAETAQDKLDALVARVSKVRRWLVTLAVLRVAALCLAFVSVYVGVYAWLDHRVNFGQMGRVTAMLLLIAGLALLLQRLAKRLLGHVSCSAAANYIENKQSFNQQLVTAIEYYENKQDYPYSTALAEQLVLQVERDSAEYRFDAAVQKWQGYVLGAIVVLGLAIASFYVKDNYVYFSSYFARLIRPLASVEALSPTHLESITKNLVAEPDSEVTFTAEIEGRAPESGELVVVGSESEDAEGDGKQEGGSLKAEGFGDRSIEAIPRLRLRLPPINEGQTARLEASKSFSKPGQFKYRFEAGSTSTPWHTLNISPAPEIEGMTAQVTLPRQPPRRKWVKPYTEQIEKNTLEVIPGSSVTLNVQATDKLKEVVATGLDGKSRAKSLNGAEQFAFQFTADKSGSVRFDLVNELGLTSNDLPGLEVIVKTDEPPKFDLLSPEGDYLATDVASVPVTFEVTDDFGLESVEMCLEMPGQEPTRLPIPLEEGTRSKTFTHVIELEEYNLHVGDSVLFYARAMDVDTGSALANRTSSSEVYFIEIRPYRQNWRSKPGGGPSPSGLPAPVELLNILEYTRAIVKKTWSIAEKPDPTDEDRSGLESIDNDVRYCAEQLTLIRDDSDYGFTEPQKAVLNTVLRCYEQASGYLTRHEAASAMTPEKNAYRILRKFILESELELNPPQSGQSPPDEKPESVKMQEKPPEYSQMEAERVEDELKQMQQKLDKLTKEQEVLKRTFKSFLEQKAGDKQSAQKATSQESSDVTAGENGQDKAAENQQAQASPGQQGELSSSDQDSQASQRSAESQTGSQGQSLAKSKSASASPGSNDKQDNAESQSRSKGQDSEKGESVSGRPNTDNKQKTAESPRVQQVPKGQAAHPTEKQSSNQGQGGTQGQIPGEDKNAASGRDPGKGKDIDGSQGESQAHGGSPSGTANDDLRLRMLQAKQKALQEQVSQLKRDLQQLPQTSQSGSNEGRTQAQKHLDEALAKMDSFQVKLTESRYQADMDARQSSEAIETVEAAKHQMDLAQKAIERELTWSDDQRMANEAQEMAEQLAADADAFDESVTEAERDDMLARLEAAKRLLELMPEPQWARIGPGRRTRSSPAAVLTKNPNLAPAEAARQMARQFWSIALNAKKRQQQLIEDDSSDVRFYGQENEFFEDAAKFEAEPVQK